MRYCLLLISAFIGIVLLSCSSEPEPTLVHIKIEHIYKGGPIKIGEVISYLAPTGSQFLRVDKLKYYISNVKLKNQGNGKEWAEPDSYHLVKVTEESVTFELVLENVTEGTYDAIEFAIGVDSDHNHKTDQVGDLDPSNDMVWNWNTGYKFFICEGEVINMQGAGKGLVYHMGTDSNYRPFHLKYDENEFPGFVVREEKPLYFTIQADIGAVFNGEHHLDLYEQNEIMHDPEQSAKVFDNLTQSVFLITEVDW